MMINKFDNDYAQWCMRADIADCLRELGLITLAEKVLASSANIGIIHKYVSIIKSIAIQTNNVSIIDRLCFKGLINSHGGLI